MPNPWAAFAETHPVDTIRTVLKQNNVLDVAVYRPSRQTKLKNDNEKDKIYDVGPDGGNADGNAYAGSECDE